MNPELLKRGRCPGCGENTEPPIAPESPCDPDRSYAYRDSGGGDEDADDVEPPIGPVDTPQSYAFAMARYPSFVRP